MTSRQASGSGILAIILLIAGSLLMNTSVNPSIVSSWLTLILICMIPIYLIKIMYLQNTITDSIDQLVHPFNTILRVSITIIAGLIVFQIIQFLFEGLGSRPTPSSIIYAVNNLVLTMFFVIVFEGWPFKLIKNKIVSAILLLMASMSVSYLMFQSMLNFSEYILVPFYSESFDPRGLYPLSFMVAVIVVILAFVLFGQLLKFWSLKIKEN